LKEISSEKKPSILIYPNPTASIVHVEGENIETAKVFDIKGKLLFTKRGSRLTSTLKIDLAQQPNSTYVIEVQTSYGVASKVIIKQ